MRERIQKILSSRGVASRRHAEALITAGRITCNGNICHLGDTADPELDQIQLDGRDLPSRKDYTYILLHKPRGYVTTLSDERGRKTVAQLVSDCGCRVYPVGRLDMDSEGLLLFTNDGELANRWMHPRHMIDKVYDVTVRGYSEQACERLRKSIILDGYRICAPEVIVLRGTKNPNDKAHLRVTIHEGRNRQVRRMCDIAGMKVVRLVRIQEGSLCLGSLPLGKWRYLNSEEIETVRKL